MYLLSMSHVIASLSLLYTVLLITSAGNISEIINVGTSLYNTRHLSKIWTEQEAIKLHSRMMIDQLLPRQIPDGNTFIEYFKLVMNKSEIIDCNKLRKQTIIVIIDAMGGYMHGVLLPNIKESYYEGHVSFDVTNKLYEIIRKIKFFLGTDGRGWTNLVSVDKSSMGDVTDIVDEDFGDLPEDPSRNSCAALHLLAGVNGGDNAVLVPAFDDNRLPGSVIIPFATEGRLFDVNDNRPLLLWYYRLAVECTSAAPDQFREDMGRWLDEAVVPLLNRRKRWYPVLFGISRVIQDTKSSSGRYKRKTAVSSDIDVEQQCDDEPISQLPNSNVFLFVIWLSLMFTWLCFGMLSIHKAIRYAVDSLAACLGR